jgi:hypothetical protein
MELKLAQHSFKVENNSICRFFYFILFFNFLCKHHIARNDLFIKTEEEEKKKKKIIKIKKITRGSYRR